MITRRTLLQSALFLPVVPRLLAKSAVAQEVAAPNSPWLEPIAQQLRDEFKLPAVWMAVNLEDQVEAAVVGVKNIDSPMPATLDDKLTLASVSKPMVGLWIATLVEAGKISYETKVLDVLPQLKPFCLAQHSDITLRELLLHTAGVARDVKSPRNAIGLEQYPAERLSQARELLSQPSPPGSKGKMLYSNSGVTLAATMAERAVGEPYESVAGRFYRERLGLKSWGVWEMRLPDGLTRPWPHFMQENGNGFSPVSPRISAPRLIRPSGNAHCTITDLVRFGLIATNSTELSKSLLSQPAWNAVLESQPNTNEILISFNVKGPRFFHSGSLQGVRSHLVSIPSRKVSVAIHVNADSDEARERAMDLIMNAVRQRRNL